MSPELVTLLQAVLFSLGGFGAGLVTKFAVPELIASRQALRAERARKLERAFSLEDQEIEARNRAENELRQITRECIGVMSDVRGVLSQVSTSFLASNQQLASKIDTILVGQNEMRFYLELTMTKLGVEGVQNKHAA